MVSTATKVSFPGTLSIVAMCVTYRNLYRGFSPISWLRYNTARLTQTFEGDSDESLQVCFFPKRSIVCEFFSQMRPCCGSKLQTAGLGDLRLPSRSKLLTSMTQTNSPRHFVLETKKFHVIILLHINPGLKINFVQEVRFSSIYSDFTSLFPPAGTPFTVRQNKVFDANHEFVCIQVKKSIDSHQNINFIVVYSMKKIFFFGKKPYVTSPKFIHNSCPRI